MSNNETPWWKDPDQRTQVKIGEIVLRGDIWVHENDYSIDARCRIGEPLRDDPVKLYRRKEMTDLEKTIKDLETRLTALENKKDNPTVHTPKFKMGDMVVTKNGKSLWYIQSSYIANNKVYYLATFGSAASNVTQRLAEHNLNLLVIKEEPVTTEFKIGEIVRSIYDSTEQVILEISDDKKSMCVSIFGWCFADRFIKVP